VVSSFELDGRRSLFLAPRVAEVWGVDRRASQIDFARATARELGIKNVPLRREMSGNQSCYGTSASLTRRRLWILHRIGDILALLLRPGADTEALSVRTALSSRSFDGQGQSRVSSSERDCARSCETPAEGPTCPKHTHDRHRQGPGSFCLLGAHTRRLKTMLHRFGVCQRRPPGTRLVQGGLLSQDAIVASCRDMRRTSGRHAVSHRLG